MIDKKMIELIKNNINDIKIVGKENNINIKKALPINDANENAIVWLKETAENPNQIFSETRSKCIVCHESINIDEQLLKTKMFILTKNPKNTFIKILGLLFPSDKLSGVHPSAIIIDSVIGEDTYIGPNVIIERSEIGNNCQVLGNNFIHSNTVIKDNVKINPGTTIGSDGFGYSRDPKTNVLDKFPHFGGVVIEANVEIGSNVCIDKGTLGNTIIQKGTKIDNLVHIAHNVNIGQNCLIIANSMIAGSAVIGDNSWISPSSNIINGITIGTNVTVGMGALVTKNIPDNEIWAGFPAKQIDEFKLQQKKIDKL